MAVNLCSQVVKFSFATGVRSDGAVPWTHVAASNMFAVVNGADIGTANGRLDIRVVKGSEVLESIDIASYVHRANMTRTALVQAGNVPQCDQLPIFGIAKDPLLAIRYRLDDGQSRRLQLKFSSFQECRNLTELLQRCGMQFQEHRPKTGCSETTQILASSTGRGGNVVLQETAATSSPHFQQPLATPARLAVAAPIATGGQSHMPQAQFPGQIDWSSSTHSDPLTTTVLPSMRGRSAAAATPRPSSSASMGAPDTLEHEIPPRRELPFSRPSSRQKNDNKSNPRPSSAAASLPPLPTPTWLKPSTVNPVVPPGSGQEIRPGPAILAPSSLGHGDRSLHVPPLSERLQAPSTRPLSCRSPNKPPSRMDDLLYGKQLLDEQQGRSSTLQLNEAIPAPSTNRQMCGTPHREPLTTSETSRSGPRQDCTVKPYATVQTSAQEKQEMSLADYCAQSQADRSAALDNFMIEQLENPHFVQLCEDVENCWRRIVLGL